MRRRTPLLSARPSSGELCRTYGSPVFIFTLIEAITMTELAFQPSNRLQGKVAIVTGAGCVGPGWGNGRAVAVAFAQAGAKIFAVDKDLGAMDETLRRIEE